MTTTVIVAHKRPEILTHAIDSYFATVPAKRRALWVIANDKATADSVTPSSECRLWSTTRNLGFWGGLNAAVSFMEPDQRFCWFGKDVEFQSGWLDKAEATFERSFPDGLGMLAFYDGIHFGNHASHAMQTPRWLEVIYGERRFPAPPYRHLYLDSELSHWTQLIGRLVYEPESRVLHQHAPDWPDETPFDPTEDEQLCRARHEGWVNGGEQAARERLRELVPA